MIAERLNGIGEYYFAAKLKEIEELRSTGRHILNLGIGSPDLAPHPEVVAVLQAESSKTAAHAYQGYRGAAALREAFAGWYERFYNVRPDPVTELLPLMGSKEGIMHICMTYLNPGDKALVPDPGYPAYASAVRLAGADPFSYALTEVNDWLPDYAALEQGGLSDVKLMFVNYPHMPSGKVASQQELEQLVAFASKHDILLVYDNPYSFILNDRPSSIMSVAGAGQVALELNSLSKSHNMAGWRVGILYGAAERINDVLRFKSNMDSGMFLPVQLAAAKALQLGADWYAELNGSYRARREKIYALLDSLGCRYSKHQAGLFLWAKVPADYEDGYRLSDELLYEAGVFVTPGGVFGKEGNAYIRISLCRPETELEEACFRVRQLLLMLKTAVI